MTPLDRKGDFFDFGGVTYLNCAYQGPMPRAGIRALQEAVELKTRPHLITERDYFDIPDRYRSAVAELIGCPASEVAICSGQRPRRTPISTRVARIAGRGRREP